MEQLSLGFIGCGAMGSAIISGIVKSNTVPAEHIWVYDVDADKPESIKNKFAVNMADDLSELCRESDYIFLAVKPADLQDLLENIRDCITGEHLLISVIAGKTTEFIESIISGDSSAACGDNAGNHPLVIRLMPNTPCLIGEGVVAVAPGSRATEDQVASVERLVEPLGLTVNTREKYMDAITALSGSGPGYAFVFMEALVDGAVNSGLDRPTAEKMASQTLLGAAAMARDTGRSLADLKGSVTSPGGTTIAAINLMENRAFRGTVMDAVGEATRKAGELNKGK